VGDRFERGRTLLSELPRPSHAAFGDLNGDGLDDFVLCMFGNNGGRFSWFENLGDGGYKEHRLLEQPGALRSVLHDFNRDGHLDIAVLVSQHWETFHIFYNDGKGRFRREDIFQKHPLYGHSYFELADFNGDGHPDLLVTNGDNGDYPSPLKNYHGIRIYLNRGDNRFDEAFFYPLNGAYKAVARDFDGDGHLDIAAISFFPDYEAAPRESFVFLKNRGGLDFTAHTIRECIAGRWLTMDAGDLTGNGRPEIILGSFIQGPTPVPDFLMNTWKARGPAMLLLRNESR
jgi:hypothetical protein